MRAVLLVVAASCASPASDARTAFVIDTLAQDNYAWALRDPELVAMKLVKMQRSPFIWLRGTAAVYWREQLAYGDRGDSAFASPARVLLVGDPHPENLGTYGALVDWDDFDAAGYGPFQLDVRRLAIGMVIATGNDATAREAALGYARGGEPASKYLDKLVKKGLADDAAASFAPNGEVAFGDNDPVAPDGVIENRLEPVGLEAAQWIAQAVAPRTAVLQARVYGSGVSSYPALRYQAILDDGSFVELKEERDGVIVTDVPHWSSARWASPGARSVAAQRELQAQDGEDPLLRSADVGALSLRIQGESGRKGVKADDLATLDADEQLAIAHRFGAELARAHAGAAMDDGRLGGEVIAPLLAGREDEFADEIAAAALAGADQLRADYEALKDVDLAKEIIP